MIMLMMIGTPLLAPFNSFVILNCQGMNGFCLQVRCDHETPQVFANLLLWSLGIFQDFISNFFPLENSGARNSFELKFKISGFSTCSKNGQTIFIKSGIFHGEFRCWIFHFYLFQFLWKTLEVSLDF